jgi:hypothetical protein
VLNKHVHHAIVADQSTSTTMSTFFPIGGVAAPSAPPPRRRAGDHSHQVHATPHMQLGHDKQS